MAKSAASKNPKKKTAARSKAKAKKATTKTAKPKKTSVKSETAAQEKEAQLVESSVFKPLFALRHQIDELMEDALGRLQTFQMPSIEWPSLATDEPESSIARFDFSEDDKAVTVIAEVPGMSEEDIEIVVEDGMLTIKGEKKSEREKKGKNYYLSERKFGSFSRAFRLPEGVLEDQISADFDKGILKVTMPKAVVAKKAAKRISLTPK